MLKETSSVTYSEEQTYNLDQNHQRAEKNVSAGSDMIRFYWLRLQTKPSRPLLALHKASSSILKSVTSTSMLCSM